MKVIITFDKVPIPEPEPVPTIPLYMVQEDIVLFGRIRSCAPCPGVVVLKDDPHTPFDEQWQYYLRAINYTMTPVDVSYLMDYQLAFMNRTGTTNPDDQRVDWILGKYKDRKSPQFDKVRTCVRNVITGTEVYSLLEGIKSAFYFVTHSSGIMAFRQNVIQSLTSDNLLKVMTFNCNNPPPLKPGRSYPQNVNEVNLDDYFYNPRDNRERFIVANIVKNNGEVYQFPRGGLYSWFENGLTPASFVPIVSNPSYGDVLFPLRFLKRVSSVPKPYRP